MAMGALLLVAGAVAAPSLLDRGAKHAPKVVPASVKIPTYVTGGQRAAAATLKRAILGVALGKPPTESEQNLDERLDHHLLRVLRGLRLTRGPLVGGATFAEMIGEIASLQPLRRYPHFAALSSEDAIALCDAWIAAIGAGAASEVEPYELVTGGGLFASAGTWLQRAAFESLARGGADDERTVVAAGSSYRLTDLGRALRELRRASAGAAWGEIGEPDEAHARKVALEVQLALVKACGEADNVGWRATGDPRRFAPLGVGDALAQSGDYLAGLGGDVAEWAAKKAAGVIGAAATAVVFSTPGLIALGVGGVYLLHRFGGVGKAAP